MSAAPRKQREAFTVPLPPPGSKGAERPVGPVAASHLAVLELIPDAFIAVDPDWQVVYLNLAAERILGVPAARIVGALLWEHFPEAVEAGWPGRFQEAARSRTPARAELVSGATRTWLEAIVNPGEQGVGIYLRDISDRKRAEQSLRDSEHFARTILSSVGEGIVVFDRNLRCRLWNRFMKDLTGLASTDVIGRNAVELFSSIDRVKLKTLLQHVLRGDRIRLHDIGFLLSEKATRRWVDGFFSPQFSPDGEIIGVVGIIHDVSERKRSEERLLHSAFHDPLTGLPNRSFFMDRLRRSSERASLDAGFRFALIFLDLDRFKVINDSLGHQAGDELLLQFARRLEKSVRPGDIVARLGGDEFAVLLYDLNDESIAVAVAHRIQVQMNTAFSLGGRDIYTTASVGIALSTSGYDRPEDILRDADIAMYQAKTQGRGRFEVFGADMRSRAVALLQIETDLRSAVEHNQFELHYQPIIALQTQRLTGFEALLRWHHPEWGLVSPTRFVEVAEDTGLILPIGEWVMEEACQQLRTWRQELGVDATLSIHVNLSGKQFLQPDGIQRIAQLIQRYGLEGGGIKLEITESIILEQADAVSRALEELRARGVHLSIDDFGTGYSSLAYLHRFPFDTLKIDRSFVSSKAEGDSNMEIVRAIISLAHNLGMDVIAEGIETTGQLAALRNLGCEYGQGYLFSDALDRQSAGEYIVRHRHAAIRLPDEAQPITLVS